MGIFRYVHLIFQAWQINKYICMRPVNVASKGMFYFQGVVQHDSSMFLMDTWVNDVKFTWQKVGQLSCISSSFKHLDIWCQDYLTANPHAVSLTSYIRRTFLPHLFTTAKWAWEREKRRKQEREEEKEKKRGEKKRRKKKKKRKGRKRKGKEK